MNKAKRIINNMDKENAVKIAKKLYAKSNNITEFLNLLNEADIGGKNLHISGDKSDFGVLTTR